jgi:hypothetical protein
MARSLLLLLAAATLFAADDPWTKVKELKSGADVAVFRKGATKPVEAKLDEARDDVIVIVVKNQQTAIPKEEVDRVDVRPKGRKTSSEVRKGTNMPDGTPPVGMNHGPNVPSDGWTGGVTFTKPGYETIYRRPSPAPHK